VQRVVVDANVLLSFITGRIEKQRDTAKALLLRAAEGELSAIVPQFVVFETVYVLQSTYRIPGNELAPIIRDLIALPGALFIDECPWKRVLDLWPSPFPSIADAAIVAIAANNRYDAIATFDQKLAKRLNDFSVASYW
jgi:predicted nucleic acid-binding protein